MVARIVLDRIAGSLVELPITDERRVAFGIGDFVHVLPDLLLRAGYRPDTGLGDFAVQRAVGVVGIADEELAGIGPTAVFFFVLRRRIIEVTIVESTHGQIDARVVAHRRKPHILALALQLAIDENPYRARRLVISACDMVPYAFVQDLAGITPRELTEGRTAARTVELQLLALEIRVADTQK